MRILDVADGEHKLVIALGIYTGMRLGDCATLKWTEVEFDRNQDPANTEHDGGCQDT